MGTLIDDWGEGWYGDKGKQEINSTKDAWKKCIQHIIVKAYLKQYTYVFIYMYHTHIFLNWLMAMR